MKGKVLLVLAIAAGAIFLGSSTAAATAPTGGFKATLLVKGAMANPVSIEGLGIHFETEGPTDVITQVVDFPAKSGSGWHAHPGLVIVRVKSGTIVFHFGCRAETFVAGQSFTEPPLEAGLAENVSDAPAQSYATLVVPAGRAARIDTPAPICDGPNGGDGGDR